MARTKEEIVAILTKRHTREMFENSVWADLVKAIQGTTPSEKGLLVKMLVDGNPHKAGKALMALLYADAEVRAKIYVDGILADDSLSLEELDSLL